MKKIICILTILLILCSCSTNSLDDCILKLNNIFSNLDSLKMHYTNNNTKYYSYYLPGDIQEYEYGDTYHHLVFNNSDFVMNLNINYIFCENVFNKIPENPFDAIVKYAVYDYNNLNTDDANKYNFRLYFMDEKYYFSLFTNKFNFFGITNISEIDKLLPHLLEINNSASINKDDVIKMYYLGTTIDYTPPEVELYDKFVPPSGLLEDLVKIEDTNLEKDNIEEESSDISE